MITCHNTSLISMSRKGSRFFQGDWPQEDSRWDVCSAMWTCPTGSQIFHLSGVPGHFLIHSHADCVVVQMIIATFPLYTHISAFSNANKPLLAGRIFSWFSLFFLFFFFFNSAMFLIDWERSHKSVFLTLNRIHTGSPRRVSFYRVNIKSCAKFWAPCHSEFKQSLDGLGLNIHLFVLSIQWHYG